MPCVQRKPDPWMGTETSATRVAKVVTVGCTYRCDQLLRRNSTAFLNSRRALHYVSAPTLLMILDGSVSYVFAQFELVFLIHCFLFVKNPSLILTALVKLRAASLQKVNCILPAGIYCKLRSGQKTESAPVTAGNASIFNTSRIEKLPLRQPYKYCCKTSRNTSTTSSVFPSFHMCVRCIDVGSC